MNEAGVHPVGPCYLEPVQQLSDMRTAWILGLHRLEMLQDPELRRLLEEADIDFEGEVLFWFPTTEGHWLFNNDDRWSRDTHLDMSLHSQTVETQPKPSLSMTLYRSWKTSLRWTG